MNEYYNNKQNEIFGLSPLDIQNGRDKGLTKLTPEEVDAHLNTSVEIIAITSVTKLNLMTKLREIGLWADLRLLLIADDDVWDDWSAATSIDIEYPLVATMRDAMGWTPEQLQDLFNGIGSA